MTPCGNPHVGLGCNINIALLNFIPFVGCCIADGAAKGALQANIAVMRAFEKLNGPTAGAPKGLGMGAVPTVPEYV